METTPETWKWLVQQGLLGVVLLIVLFDYKRTYQRLVEKLNSDKGELMTVVKENTTSNNELREECRRWSRVTEEAFPRGGRRGTDHQSFDGS